MGPFTVYVQQSRSAVCPAHEERSINTVRCVTHIKQKAIITSDAVHSFHQTTNFHHNPPVQRSTWPIWTQYSTFRRSRYPPLAFTTIHEQPFPLPHYCGIGQDVTNSSSCSGMCWTVILFQWSNITVINIITAFHLIQTTWHRTYWTSAILLTSRIIAYDLEYYLTAVLFVPSYHLTSILMCP
jgi:hypothetical protein